MIQVRKRISQSISKVRRVLLNIELTLHSYLAIKPSSEKSQQKKNDIKQWIQKISSKSRSRNTARSRAGTGTSYNLCNTSSMAGRELESSKQRKQEELLHYYRNKEMEECTFVPITNHQSGNSRRNLQQFLNDQSQFTARKGANRSKVNFLLLSKLIV